MHGGSTGPDPAKKGSDARSQIAENIHIYGNIFEHNRTSGNGVIGGWSHSTFWVRHVRIYNNTMVNVVPIYNPETGRYATGGGNIFWAGWHSGSDVIVRNNLWYNCPTPAIRGDIVSNNWINPSANPFVDYSAKDYRLVATSPTGYSFTPSPWQTYEHDMNGVQRGRQGGNWDIGAFEYPQTGGDVIKPVIIMGGKSPVPGATNVPTNSVITVTFSEAMDGTTINSSNLTLSNGGPVAGTVSYNSSTFMATFTPGSILSNSTLYTFTVSTSVVDVAQNSMAAQEQWTFMIT